MMQRPVLTWKRAANDNVWLAPRADARAVREFLLMPMPMIRRGGAPTRPQPFHIGPRTLLIAGFSALVLVALSSAALIALAAVGVLAASVAGAETLRRTLRRPSLDAAGWAKARN
jgi:hypothetical protein